MRQRPYKFRGKPNRRGRKFWKMFIRHSMGKLITRTFSAVQKRFAEICADAILKRIHHKIEYGTPWPNITITRLP